MRLFALLVSCSAVSGFGGVGGGGIFLVITRGNTTDPEALTTTLNSFVSDLANNPSILQYAFNAGESDFMGFEIFKSGQSEPATLVAAVSNLQDGRMEVFGSPDSAARAAMAQYNPVYRTDQLGHFWNPQAPSGNFFGIYVEFGLGTFRKDDLPTIANKMKSGGLIHYTLAPIPNTDRYEEWNVFTDQTLASAASDPEIAQALASLQFFKVWIYGNPSAESRAALAPFNPSYKTLGGFLVNPNLVSK